MTAEQINDVDERLLWLLRRAGDEWGPTGVAKAAALLAEPDPGLYVNHPRTEPVPGDVVREEDPEGATTWLMDSFGTWQSKDSTCKPEHMEFQPLRLLVDGETGMTVPS